VMTLPPTRVITHGALTASSTGGRVARSTP
jgi:hypothetical protein